jgi:hypothetical protein
MERSPKWVGNSSNMDTLMPEHQALIHICFSTGTLAPFFPNWIADFSDALTSITFSTVTFLVNKGSTFDPYQIKARVKRRLHP